MDSPTAAPPAFQFPRLRLAHGLIVAAFVAYAVFLALHMGAYAGGSDSSGYLNSARLLSRGTTHMAQRVLPGLDLAKAPPYLFAALGFKPLANQQMAPTYPIGLPLAVVAMAKIAGWRAAPHLLMGLSALLGLVLTAALGRLAGLPRGWAWFGALILGTCPLYVFMSLQLMSDVPATALALATILCAWRSRRHAAWALLAGFAMAAGVLTRPSNLVLLLPVAVALGVNWRCWLGLGLGGLPGAFVQCFYNYHAYGHAFESGYGVAGSLFGLGNIPASLRNYAQWLPVLLTPAGLFAFALPWSGPERRFAWVLLAWIAAVLGFYLCYFHTHETWWYLRFLLPAFPAFIVGGLCVVHRWWLDRSSRPAARPLASSRLAAGLALAIIANAVVWNLQLNTYNLRETESVYPDAVGWAQAHVPANATFVAMQCTGALVCYSDFLFVRWDNIEPAQAPMLAQASLAAGRPVYAMLFPFEVKDALELRLPGHWTQTAAIRHVSIWKWEATAP